MYGLLRPLLFLLPPAAAHAAGMAALWPLERSTALAAFARRFTAARGPARTVMGLSFPSPVGVAGGFDKNATRARALAALGFGFVELGTVTNEPQGPNPAPNLFRLPADRALVNRLGFPNQGARAVAARVRAYGKGAIGVPVAFSIGKSRSVDVEDLDRVVEDYAGAFEAVRDVSDFVVVNVSSPNTKNLRALQSSELATRLLGELARRAGSLPLLVKIAPDLDDDALEALLGVVDRAGIAGVVATNTTVAREGLSTPPDVVARIGAGGLSGPPLHARALAFVGRSRARLGSRAVVIGVGGIDTVAGAQELLDRGADLLQVYTGFVYRGPSLPCLLARGLALGGAATEPARPASTSASP